MKSARTCTLLLNAHDSKNMFWGACIHQRFAMVSSTLSVSLSLARSYLSSLSVLSRSVCSGSSRRPAVSFWWAPLTPSYAPKRVAHMQVRHHLYTHPAIAQKNLPHTLPSSPLASPSPRA